MPPFTTFQQNHNIQKKKKKKSKSQRKFQKIGPNVKTARIFDKFTSCNFPPILWSVTKWPPCKKIDTDCPLIWCVCRPTPLLLYVSAPRDIDSIF